MDFVKRSPTGDAITLLSDDDLITIHACIRESLEALSNSTEFRIRVGVDPETAIDLMKQVRDARLALARSKRPEPGEGAT
jgi:hypothetical protein